MNYKQFVLNKASGKQSEMKYDKNKMSICFALFNILYNKNFNCLNY